MFKFFTRRNVLLCHALMFAFVMFVISFFFQLRVNQTDYVRYVNAFWGCTYAFKNTTKITMETAFGIKSVGLLGLPFAGFLLVFFGALGAFFVATFVKKPFAKWIIVGCAVVMLAGAIMQFFPVASFVRAGCRALQRKNGWTEQQFQEQVKNWLPAFRNNGANAPVASIMGVLGLLASFAVAGAAFIDCKCCCKEECCEEQSEECCDEAPAEEVPAEEPKAEEPKAEEAPVEEAPAEEAKAE